MTESARLKQEIARIRQTVEERHRGNPRGPAVAAENGSTPVDDAAGLARVNAHWGITSTLPVVGRGLVMFRRVLRLALRWYINPVVEQQNEFNQSVVRALYDLESRVEAIESETRASQENRQS